MEIWKIRILALCNLIGYFKEAEILTDQGTNFMSQLLGATELIHLFSRVGIPAEILSDQGTNTPSNGAGKDG